MRTLEDNILYECGVDIDSSFTFKDGDIQLSKYDENLVQAVINRLKTNLNELDIFYEEYGSILTNFFGWKATEKTLDYMTTEISVALSNESRLNDFEIEIEYLQNGKIKINLVLVTVANSTVETSLVLTENGVTEISIEEGV